MSGVHQRGSIFSESGDGMSLKAGGSIDGNEEEKDESAAVLDF
jgi:hypothetical protein